MSLVQADGLRRHSGQQFSMQEKDAARFTLNRIWRPHLSADEWYLLDFIRDSTIEWGRETLDTTWPQLKGGIPGTQMWSWARAPIGISRAMYFRVKEQLSNKGALIVESVHRSYTLITLNRDWKPDPETPSMNEVMALARSHAFEKAIRELHPNSRRTDNLARHPETSARQPETQELRNKPLTRQSETPYKHSNKHRITPPAGSGSFHDPERGSLTGNIRKRTRPISIPEKDET